MKNHFTPPIMRPMIGRSKLSAHPNSRTSPNRIRPQCSMPVENRQLYLACTMKAAGTRRPATLKLRRLSGRRRLR